MTKLKIDANVNKPGWVIERPICRTSVPSMAGKIIKKSAIGSNSFKGSVWKVFPISSPMIIIMSAHFPKCLLMNIPAFKKEFIFLSYYECGRFV